MLGKLERVRTVTEIDVEKEFRGNTIENLLSDAERTRNRFRDLSFT